MDQQKISDVIGRLKSAAGSAWKDAEWDGLQAGSPDAAVTGIAVAWSPSIDVLKRATAAGCNLVITKDPLYWWEKEGPLPSPDSSTSRVNEGIVGMTKWDVVEANPVYKAKRDLVAESKLNVLRVSENWELTNSLALEGLMDALKWKPQDSFIADPRIGPHAKTAVVTLPSQTLLQAAQTAKQRIGARSVRLLGDKNANITKLAVHPGFLTIAGIRRIAQTPNLDLIIAGEGCEWEAFPYAEDWIDAGHGKGFAMLGLAVTADTGARQYADWVRSTVFPVKVEFFPLGDPFTPITAGAVRA